MACDNMQGMNQNRQNPNTVSSHIKYCHCYILLLHEYRRLPVLYFTPMKSSIMNLSLQKKKLLCQV